MTFLLIGGRRYNKASLEWIEIDPQDAKYLHLQVAGKEYRVGFSTSSAATAALTEILTGDTIVNLND